MVTAHTRQIHNEETWMWLTHAPAQALNSCYSRSHSRLVFWRWMDGTVDLIYCLMHNACCSNWIGLLHVNVCFSISAVQKKKRKKKKRGNRAKSHPCAHVGRNGLISLHLYSWRSSCTQIHADSTYSKCCLYVQIDLFLSKKFKNQ